MRSIGIAFSCERSPRQHAGFPWNVPYIPGQRKTCLSRIMPGHAFKKRGPAQNISHLGGSRKLHPVFPVAVDLGIADGDNLGRDFELLEYLIALGHFEIRIGFLIV
jgi:hypothetical protein